MGTRGLANYGWRHLTILLDLVFSIINPFALDYTIHLSPQIYQHWYIGGHSLEFPSDSQLIKHAFKTKHAVGIWTNSPYLPIAYPKYLFVFSGSKERGVLFFSPLSAFFSLVLKTFINFGVSKSAVCRLTFILLECSSWWAWMKLGTDKWAPLWCHKRAVIKGDLSEGRNQSQGVSGCFPSSSWVTCSSNKFLFFISVFSTFSFQMVFIIFPHGFPKRIRVCSDSRQLCVYCTNVANESILLIRM